MIIGSDWVFIENPKTGSTSIRDAFGNPKIKIARHAPLISENIIDYKTLRAVVVRNPFDRMVSAWTHRTNTEKKEREPFEEFLLGDAWGAGVGLDIKRVPQLAWTFRCNYVIRFEELQESWPKFLKVIDEEYRPLGHENSTKHLHYRDIFTPKTRAIVEDRFAPDLKEWGYKY